MTPAALAGLLGGDADRGRALRRLAAAGVERPEQVPLYLPTRFLDARHPVRRFEALPMSGDVVVVGRYAGDFDTRWRPGRRGRGSPQGRGTLLDERGRRLTFSRFGDSRGFVKALEAAGVEVAMAGTLHPVGSQPWLNNPSLLDPALLGHVLPQYPGRPRVLATQTARALVCSLLPMTIPGAATSLRERVLDVVEEERLRELIRYPRGSLEDLLWAAHLPSSPEAGEHAQQVLERLAAVLTVGELRRLNGERPPVRRRFAPGPWDDLSGRLPYSLTDEQRTAIDALNGRLGGPVVSATLINADVGMGKSIVYQVACANLVRAGGRVAVLLPNERLAVQSHADILRLFPEQGAMLVTGRSTGDVAGARWLVGTTALLFREPGHLDAVVVDEQHRFSVEQRRALAREGTHVIEISATPIPRTQALLLYGELDVIRLIRRHTPQDIRTKLVTRRAARDMVADLREVVESGGRLLIVCPRREDGPEDDEDSLPSVPGVAAKWEALFPGQVRALHGESAPEEAERAFSDLAEGSARILVATTVVEVGLNIPELRALVVVHAERFGISQLHQLRGRLAREGGAGRCYLYLPRPVGDDARMRLEAVASTSDGFELAEHDMRIRGIGDVSNMGARQHGSTGNLLLTRNVPMATFIDMLEALGAPAEAAQPRT